MAIGTTAAIIGATALVGAGASILGSKAQAKAANNASDASQYGYELQYDLGQQSLALQEQLHADSLGLSRDIYGANWSVLSPYVSQGNVAGQYYNALLGLPSAPVIPNPLGTTAAPSAPASSGTAAPAPAAPGAVPSAAPAPSSAPPAVPTLPPPQSPASHLPGGGAGVAANMASVGATPAGDIMSPAYRTSQMAGEPPMLPQIGPGSPTGSVNGSVPGAGNLGTAPATSAPPTTTPAGTGPPPITGTPAASSSPPVNALTAEEAFKAFADSAGMQFQMEQGTNAINHLYAGAGALQSGAAMKAINDYAQQMALQNYFMPYMGMLGGQQAMGAQAASSIAGVGSNFADTAANLNSSYGSSAANINAGIGSAAGQNAANQGNIYMQQGANQANMWNNLGTSFGTALGGLAAPPSSGGINVTGYGTPQYFG